jgi:PST family polysaccharide transporter
MAQIGQLLSQQGDNLVVGRWLGAAALGVYGRAYNLMVMPATAFGRIVNRVLFPVMAQVQDERDRLANAYERSLAIVALLSLPLSTFLWVVAPELIPMVLGPAWGAVVLPFRLFSISLLFRMSSKISDACTKAAGEVYKRAVIQFAYAGLVVVGAIIGQRWGVGGVAVCVSIAMGINWLNMAQLGKTVTGLDWARFVRAHLPAALLALVIAAAAVAGAQLSRAAHLGPIPLLLVAATVSAAAAAAAAWLSPALFLGPHGTWARQEVEALVRRRARAGARKGAPDAEHLAPVGKAGRS